MAVARTTPTPEPGTGLPTDPKTPWPPPQMRNAFDHMRLLSAWYGGDPEQLSMIHGGLYGSEHPFFTHGPTNKPSQYRGGVVGSVARWFWGAPTPVGEKRSKLHVPIAGDIATLSADLLFSEPPTFTVDHDATQKRLNEITETTTLDATLLEAAEVQAPLGGVYLVISWDEQLYGHPFIRAIHHDCAVPEWRWGRLHAVTFWHVVREDAGKVFRHLERHERGRILHALYLGDNQTLGPEIPLDQHPATARLERVVAGVPDRLTAAYVPNMLPNRLDRNSPLGRSDFSPGVLTLMDALDETYSSMMRDLRLAKHRLVVPRAYMQPQGPGQGSRFEADREIFEMIDSMPRQDGGMELTPTSFAIRVTEHAAIADNLVNQIVGRCGYSAQSVGEQGEVAVTATEVQARERRSMITRRKKGRYWKAELPDLLETLLMLDMAKFGTTGIEPARPTVEFGDAVAETPEALATTLSMLETAVAASTKVKVQMLHPDWDDDEVDEEVDRILAESGKGATLANPDQLPGAGPAGQLGGPRPSAGTAPPQPAPENGKPTPADQGNPTTPTGAGRAPADNRRRTRRGGGR